MRPIQHTTRYWSCYPGTIAGYSDAVSQQQRIARNTLLAIIGVAGAGIVRFTFTTATGRVFGSATLGDIALIIAVATITTIPAAGIGAAGNRFLAVASGSNEPRMRAATLAATWRGSALAIVAAAAISTTYLTTQSTASIDSTAMVLSVLYVIAYGLYLTAKGVLFGDGKADRYALGEVLGLLAFAVSFVGILSLVDTASWVVLSLVVWAAGVVAVAVAVGVGPVRLIGPAPRGMWPFAATATVGSLVSLGVIQATVLVMAALHGSEQAGLLAAAIAITAPLYLLPRSLSLALTPSMSYHVGAGSDERANIDTSFTTSVMVLFGGVAAAFVIGLGDLVLSLFGSDFTDAMPQLVLFSVAAFITISGIPIVNRFAAQGERALRLTVVASAIGAVIAGLIWFTAGRQDPIWIAIGFLAASVVKTAIPFLMSRKTIGRWILPRTGVSVLAISGIAIALLPQPWSYVGLAALVLLAAPSVYVATVRYRARTMAVARSDREIFVGVITNMYPTAEFPYYGVFVRDRVDAYRSLGAQVTVVAPSRKTGTLKYAQLAGAVIASLVRQPIPDVFEVHPTQPTGLIGWFAAAITQRPYVLYAHGSDVVRGTRAGLYTALVKAAISHADEIHTNSQFTSDAITSRWGAEPTVYVIPPGVRTDRPPGCGDHRELDVLYVGGMTEHKGVDVLITALGSMARSEPLKIAFAGDGPELDAYRRLAADEGLDIAFKQAIPHDQVARLMCIAKVVAVPSREEALGQVAIESLAAGTPVVVSDVGGLSLVPNQSCGSVVPSDNPTELANALLRWISLSQSDRDRATIAAMARAASFDITKVAAEALARFQYLAEGSNPDGAIPATSSGPSNRR